LSRVTKDSPVATLSEQNITMW